MEAISWSRRDRTQLIKDILLILAQGSVSKTKLQNLAGLNKRLFETYVEKILVRYKLVEKKRVGRVTYYTLTPRGRAYLNAAIIADAEVLVVEEEFADRVSELLLEQYNMPHERRRTAGDEELELPVDFVFNTERGPVYVYLAATHAAAMAKHCAAIVLKKITGRPALLVAPETPDSMGRNGTVPVAYYKPGSVEHAAEQLVEAVQLAKSGMLDELTAHVKDTRRVVLL